SVELARSAVAAGVEVIAATPHVRRDYPTTAETMELRLADVREALAAAGVELDVLPGGELDLHRLEELPDDELMRFGLGGNAGALLIEFPYFGWPLGLAETVFRLRTRGSRPVIGHPERSAEEQARPERLAQDVGGGRHVQVKRRTQD